MKETIILELMHFPQSFLYIYKVLEKITLNSHFY